MEVLDPTGHLSLTWDPQDGASVDKARADFQRLKEAGYAFFVDQVEDAAEVERWKTGRGRKPALVTAGSLDVRPVQTKEFQPLARRTTAVPPLRGG